MTTRGLGKLSALCALALVAGARSSQAQNTNKRIVSITCPDGREIGVDFPVDYTQEMRDKACGSVTSGGTTSSSSDDAASAIVNGIRQRLRNAAIRRQQQEEFRKQLELQRLEAKRNHDIELERQYSEKIRQLDAQLKLEGVPHLELKLGDTDGTGYGICGLPGVATQGERPGCANRKTNPDKFGPMVLKIGGNKPIRSIGSGFRRVPPTEAEELCGILVEHIRAFLGVADKRGKDVFMFQAVNPAARIRLREGAFPKPLYVKFKTEVDGPLAGFIVYDAATMDSACAGRCARIAKTIGGKKYFLLGDRATMTPFTSDYDLLAVAHYGADAAVLDPDKTPLGNVTPNENDLAIALNDAANHTVNAGGHVAGARIVANGAENLNPSPDAGGAKFPACSFEPGLDTVVILQTPDELKQYFNDLNAREFDVDPDPRWGWGKGPPWK